VRVVGLEQAKDRLTLRRDAETLLAEQVGELGAALHDNETLSTIIVEKQVSQDRAMLRRCC
jgi:hypothetical protein